MIDYEKLNIALCPGTIMSQNDGDIHYIGANQLASLYGLDIKKCKVIGHQEASSFKSKGYLILYPQYDGDYDFLGKI